jgi:hypothetical protein
MGGFSATECLLKEREQPGPRKGIAITEIRRESCWFVETIGHLRRVHFPMKPKVGAQSTARRVPKRSCPCFKAARTE